MHKKTALIALTIIILASIGASVFFLKMQKDKEIEMEKQSKDPLVLLERQFFSNPPTDTLPEDTTTIPKTEWKKNSEVLAVRALKYFEQKGLVSGPLPEEEVKRRKPILVDWGKPWKLSYLKTQLNDEELKIVWIEELGLFSDSPEEYVQREAKVQEQLARVKPSVEVDPAQFVGYYNTQADIDQAVTAGVLAKISLKNVKTADNLFTNPTLAASVQKVDDALADSSMIYEVSSATRGIELQQLLRKLGYPAVKASFHNLGKAVDFKLSADTAKVFAEFLKQKLPDGSTRMDKIDQMVKAGTYPTMEILLAQGILPKDHAIAKAYAHVKSAAPKVGIRVYDETPFFVSMDESGKVIRVAPVLHLQMVEEKSK